MNFVTRLTPRTELTRTRTSTGDKAQEKRTGLAEGAGRDGAGAEAEAEARVVTSPLHARTAPAPAGHAWKWRDSRYNCQALTPTVRHSPNLEERKKVVALSSVGSACFRVQIQILHTARTLSASQSVSRCIARTEFGSHPPSPRAISVKLEFPAVRTRSFHFLTSSQRRPSLSDPHGPRAERTLAVSLTLPLSCFLSLSESRVQKY